MLTLLFVLGSAPFWILAALLCAVEIALVENEKEVFALALIVAFFACLGLFGDFNILRAVKDHPLGALAVFGSYFVAGALWSVAKFSLYASGWRRTYNELKREFYERHKVTGNPETVPFEFCKAWEEDSGRRIHQQKAPIPTKMVGRISAWMAYWPFSLLWFIAHDPIRRIFREIRVRLQRVYDGISAHFMSGVEADIGKAAPPPPTAPADGGNGTGGRSRSGRPLPGPGVERLP